MTQSSGDDLDAYLASLTQEEQQAIAHIVVQLRDRGIARYWRLFFASHTGENDALYEGKSLTESLSDADKQTR